MSRENVDTVRECFEAFAERDFDHFLTYLDPEIEWDVSRRQMEPEVFRGHEGVRKFFDALREAWADQRFEAADYIDAGDSVVVTIRFVSTGRDGIEISATAWYVWQLRDGLVVRATMYQSKAEALKGVGLAQ